MELCDPGEPWEWDRGVVPHTEVWESGVVTGAEVGGIRGVGLCGGCKEMG